MFHLVYLQSFPLCKYLFLVNSLHWSSKYFLYHWLIYPLQNASRRILFSYGNSLSAAISLSYSKLGKDFIWMFELDQKRCCLRVREIARSCINKLKVLNGWPLLEFLFLYISSECAHLCAIEFVTIMWMHNVSWTQFPIMVCWMLKKNVRWKPTYDDMDFPDELMNETKGYAKSTWEGNQHFIVHTPKVKVLINSSTMLVNVCFNLPLLLESICHTIIPVSEIFFSKSETAPLNALLYSTQ